MWYLRIHSKILHITNTLSNTVRHMSNWLNVFFIFFVNNTGRISKLDKNPIQPKYKYVPSKYLGNKKLIING